MKAKWRINTIRKKMMAGYLWLIFVPLSLLLALSNQIGSSIIERKTLAQFENVLLLSVQQYDQYVTDLDRLSVMIVNSSLIQERLRQRYVPLEQWTTLQIGREAEVKQFLAGIHAFRPMLSSIVVYGNNGINDYFHAGRYNWNEFQANADEAWYSATLAGGGNWTLSGLRQEWQFYSSLSEPSTEQVVTFSRAILDLDTLEPLGVLAINIGEQELHGIAFPEESDGRLLILDAAGKRVVMNGGAAELQSGDEKRVSAERTSALTGWRFVYSVSEGELFRETRLLRNVMLAIGGVLTVVSVLFAHGISSGVVRPLQQFKRKMKEIGSGQFTPIELQTKDIDVAELQYAFNAMVFRIEQLIAEMQEQEREKLKLAVSELQARINPHFMYNTLNGIRFVAEWKGQAEIVELILSFVKLLKFSSKNDRALIRIEEELELIRHYVMLMQARSDSLVFRLECEPGMEHRAILPFMLQPFVENAIFHGIVPLQGRPGIVTVVLETTAEGASRVRITDNGVGMDEAVVRRLESIGKESGPTAHAGGMANVYKRLWLMYGGQASWSIASSPDRGTEVCVEWPIALEGSEHDSCDDRRG